MDDYLDANMDAEDVFPCKGCGEVCCPTVYFRLAQRQIPESHADTA